MTENEKWQEIIELAEERGFLVYSYGGVALLATPNEQEKVKEVKENE